MARDPTSGKNEGDISIKVIQTLRGGYTMLLPCKQYSTLATITKDAVTRIADVDGRTSRWK